MYLKAIKALWVLFIVGIVSALLLGFSLTNNWFNLYGELPDPSILENPKSELASELYSADGVLLGKYFRKNRTKSEYDDLSPNLIHALYASEDIRFNEHSGIDFRATLAVPYYLFKYIVLGGQKRGSSTITQQLAKNLFKIRNEANLKGRLSDVKGVNLVINKFKEWVVAVELETSYTKREILTMYLNTVDFGSNAFGIHVASETFYGVSPDQLTIPQAATLVGILQAPSFYSPRYHPDRAIYVRNKVISQMEKYNYISDKTSKELMAEDLNLNYNVENHNKGIAPYFRAEVVKDLIRYCRENGFDLYADGLKIYTTIDSRIQKYAESAVDKHMREQQGLFDEHWKGHGEPWRDREGEVIPNFLAHSIRRTAVYKTLRKQIGNDSLAIDKQLKVKKKMKVFTWDNKTFEKDTLMSSYDSLRYYKMFLQIGMMSMEPQTGKIRAWVGGINYKYFKYDHVRLGYRQPGSTFKPFLYSRALEDRFQPCSPITDVPITFTAEEAIADKPWTPKNADYYSGKTYTLRQAMSRSINTAAAYLVKELTARELAKYSADKFGFRYIRDQMFDYMVTDDERKRGITGYNKKYIKGVPSLCLGTEDVSVYEMVTAYSVFINKGTWTEPQFITRIEDKNGRVLKEFIPKKREALNEKTAWLMTYMLRGTSEEAGGTALRLNRYNFKRDKKTGAVYHVGGKTGTTANFSDAWFMGFTNDLVTGVWCGGEDRSVHFRSIKYGQGARQALPAFAYFMEDVYGDKKLCRDLGYKRGLFPEPSKPIGVELDCSKYDAENFGEFGAEADSTLEDEYVTPTETDDGIL
ncbi:transglycosylase domain-containing protein [Flammeovirga kamogawensis]|uniref:Transglycosylase domain-containing protein n=1 Tax=Flammeovirga kamogawensis TaxID=373891 RepID=A0ABX8GQB1_9BACT|nr:transglycosylase domain-containing protein [Flammeovirga kamogawensis]MBB6462035.1 penicillin-binding protein 1A [Flammeovirga kamogawensis]QWG05770.1 transglycosylase domain-containing protein [Flammeovirga kamogawensis]TRX67597.1 penicillin-binding protein [Flammeovirga kamogawensis]